MSEKSVEPKCFYKHEIVLTWLSRIEETSHTFVHSNALSFTFVVRVLE